MVDIVDVAEVQSEGMILDGIYQTKLKALKEPKLSPTGYCHHCFEEFEAEDVNKLFCSGDCATAYDRSKR